MRTKVSNIKGLYGFKEKNASGTVLFGALAKWFSLTEELGRQVYDNPVERVRTDMTSVLKKLEQTADRLEKAEDVGKNIQRKATWATVAKDLPPTGRGGPTERSSDTPNTATNQGGRAGGVD